MCSYLLPRISAASQRRSSVVGVVRMHLWFITLDVSKTIVFRTCRRRGDFIVTRGYPTPLVIGIRVFQLINPLFFRSSPNPLL